MNCSATEINSALTMLATLVLATIPNVAADEYAITDLGTLGGSDSWANDVNESGQVVGTAALPGGHPLHPFLWEDDVMIDLGTLGGCCSYGYDINNLGQVTGLSYVVDGTYHAFLWEDDLMSDLGTLPGFEYSTGGGVNDAGQIVGYSSHIPWEQNPDYTPFLWEDEVMIDLNDTLPPESDWELIFANDINEAGQIVGHGFTPEEHYYAFLLEDGEVTDLGSLPDYDSSSAHAINNVGQVVGGATKHGYPSPSYQAFLWEDGEIVGLGTLPGDHHSGARDINDQGQVVGYSSFTNTSGRRAFLWEDDVMIDLNALLPPGSGWQLASASTINEAGQIVGYGTVNGETRGFLLTPSPPGDLNGDGCVDQADLGILLADWDCTGGDCPGDCDGDGDTDHADLGILLAHWGEGCDEMATLGLQFDGLEDLGEDYVYEGWFIVDGMPVSTGRFVIDQNGMPVPGEFEVSAADAANASLFVLTIEPAEGDVPEPADTHMLAGPWDGVGATLTIGHPAALGDDFTSAAGEFILETPSTADIPEDYDQGIWWLDPDAGPGPSLVLPELPAGWEYEGWVVGGEGPITTGRFLSVSGADSDGAGPGAGPDPAPPFPGQDYIDPPMVLTGFAAVITIEPEPDNSPNPFTLKPLIDANIEDVGPGVLQSMENHAADAPTGTAMLHE